MKCLLIGPNGYVSRNIVNLYQDIQFSGFTKNMKIDSLISLVKENDCIIHTASKQRLNHPGDDFESNFILTKYIVDNCNYKRLIYISSIHANLDSDFGRVKKREEDYIKSNSNNYQILRLPHTFGLFGKPNYNSVFNTFIYAISNELDININTSDKVFNLLPISTINNYIDFTDKCSLVDDFKTVPKTLIHFVNDVYDVKYNNSPINCSYKKNILSALNYYKND